MEKSKSMMVWRTLLVLFIAFLWGGGIGAHAENKAWAKYSNGTLTFQYGEKTTLDTNEYWLNERSNNPGWSGQNSNVATVVFDKTFSEARPTSCYYWFYNFSKLETIEGIENLNTSNVTTMQFMFAGCSGLTTLDVSYFDTSNVENMWFMFWGCSGLTSLDVSNFDTSKVTNIAHMFHNCSGLTFLDVSSFDTSKVTDMQALFRGCSNLERILASDKFVTSGVTGYADGIDLFTDCKKLVGEDDFVYVASKTDKTYATVNGGYFLDKQYVRPWVKLADGTLTFQYGYKKTLGTDEYLLNEGGYSPGWYRKNSNVTTVVFDKTFSEVRPTSCCYWFYDFSKLETIEGIENLNTSEVTSMRLMFFGCSGLTSLDVSKFNTSKVQDMSEMFRSSKGLTSLDLSNFNTTNVTNMKYMFSFCSDLEKIFASDKFVTSAVTGDEEGTDLFTNCKKLVGDIAYDESKTDKTYAKADGGYFTDKVYTRPWVKYADGTLTFQYGYKKTLETDEYLLNEGSNVRGWYQKSDVVTNVVFAETFSWARPTICTRWFSGCSNLLAIEGIENLNTSNVTDMFRMFDDCSGLTSLDLSKFDTSNVTDMSSMFSGCSSLTSLDLSKFDTSNVTNMSSMFRGCSSLTSLDLSKFDTSNVTNMMLMFYDCSGLASLNLSKFDTSNVKDMSSMFNGCKGLTSLDLSKFDTSNVTDMSSMFRGCSSLTSLDLSNFDTSNVTDMYCLFYGCSGLISLDLSNFDTSNVMNMLATFSECSKLNAIYWADKFDADYLSSIYNSNIFSGCPATLYCSPKQYESFKNNSVIASFGNAVKPYVSINQKSEYGTLCVPVGSSLAEGSFTGFDKLYQVTNADKDKGTITLAEAKSIEPGVPYVYHRYLEGVDFEGKTEESSSDNASSDGTSSSESTSQAKAPIMSIITFDVDENASAAVTAPKNEGSLLKGTFESMLAKGGSYILQSDGNFHPVAADNKTLKVGAYRAYLDLSSTEIGGVDEGVGAAKGYRLVFEDGEATGIDRIHGEGTNGTDKGVYDQADQQPKVYFDLMGRKVNAPQKGEIYIVNGKKVVYNK